MHFEWLAADHLLLMMKGSRFSILLVVGLLGLLATLATLQYRWLGQISDGERERLQKRLENDSQHFAEDFNHEMNNAYFTFQMEAQVWRENDYGEFNDRLDYWKANTGFPALIKDFYFVKDNSVLKFDPNSRKFAPAEWTDELKDLSQNFGSDKKFTPLNEQYFTLSLPIYDNPQRVMMQKRKIPDDTQLPHPDLPPQAYGFLIIELDKQVILDQIFPALSKKYFSEGESSSYNVVVVKRADESNVIFTSGNNTGNGAAQYDISIPIFNLTPGSFSVYLNQDFLTKINSGKNLLIEQRFGTTLTSPQHETKLMTVDARNKNSVKTRIYQTTTVSDDGVWVLAISHRDGSLENFIGNTRRKNIAVSFGILTILGISILLIFISARRAQGLAQKQMDFVSAVSHEFRTPIAVIHSAGENLTDGLVNSKEKVERYGNLIKGEGKKLSAMVEQILEFAGARSGRKKYDFREIDVKTVIENALTECTPLLVEKDFSVEKDLAEDLPKITADANALSHAVQNLITNAVKYGNGQNSLKITAKNGGGRVKITVEDYGIGIARKDISKVFTPFYRAKSVVDAQIHGNGLGLSLVKQTVEAHNGKVKVESEVGKGSKFTISLPL